MDYEKAYKEALERAKKFNIDDAYASQGATIKSIFPQLRENEDEKIRKWLVDYFGSIKEVVWIHRDITCEQILNYLEKQKSKDNEEEYLDGIKRDWFERGKKEVLTVPELYGLEKQKEQKHPDGCFTCDEYKKGYEEGRMNGFTAGYNKAMKEVTEPYNPDDYEVVVEGDTTSLKQKEQKPKVATATLDSEKQKEPPKEELVYRLNGLMQDYIKEGKDDEEKEHRFKCYQLFWDALEDTSYFEQKEQKPVEWSEEDKQWLSEVYFAIDHSMYSNDERWAMKKYIDSLRSQSKTAEWSEEDEKHINNILVIIKYWKATMHFVSYQGCTIDADIAWLKSLRRPKSSDNWKPSEDQMNVLLNTEGMIRASGYPENAKVLASLYEELKKL